MFRRTSLCKKSILYVVWLPIAANQKNKNNKIKKKKNENKKMEKMTKIFRKKTSTKLSWPVSAKSDKTFFIQKEKKENDHGP